MKREEFEWPAEMAGRFFLEETRKWKREEFNAEGAEKRNPRAQARVPVPRQAQNPRGRGEPLPYKEWIRI
jgi:hypothetical protein